MKKFLLLSCLTVVSAYNLFAQQTCLTAQVITAGSLTVSGINGTEVPTLFCATGGSTVTAANWYKYTPSQSYSVTVTTNLPNNGSVDTRLHVYSGSCGNLTCVDGNDDYNGTALSQVTFTAMANTSYYIVFDNRWTSSGFVFQLSQDQVVNPDTLSVSFTTQTLTGITGTYNNAVVDMNGDYLDDFVSISSNNIQILYQDTAGGFTSTNYPTTTAQFLPSWSIAMGDFNDDGFNDLLYGGGNGVTFMKSTDGGTGYTQISGPQYVFSQRSNFVDMNNDGHLDAFVCHDVAPNVYYLNDGSGNLTFHQGGVGDHPNGGNYGSIWIDYNNDRLPDLFIAKCRGGQNTAKINELHRNNGDGTFTNVANQANLADPIQTWSCAWNDFDNDGWMDVVVGASSNSDGTHKFMHNNGDGTFSNITAGSGIDVFPGFSIEYVSYDFNNDGYADVFTNNAILYNNGNNIFTNRPVTMNVGAVGDLNNDGFLDVQTGTSIRYNNGNNNNWIKVTLKGTTSNSNGIGARVEIYGAWGKQIRDVRAGVGFRSMGTLNTHFGIGQATVIDSLIVRWPSGNVDFVCQPAINSTTHIEENAGTLPQAAFSVNTNSIFVNQSVTCSDSSNNCASAWNWSVTPSDGWSFTDGTNAHSQNPKVAFSLAGIYTISLVSENTNGPSTNAASQIIEVSTTVASGSSVKNNFSFYPNPVENVIYLSGNTASVKSIEIISSLGKRIWGMTDKNSREIRVDELAPGVYFLNIYTQTGEVTTSRFIKK